jgi:hypothetical protein
MGLLNQRRFMKMHRNDLYHQAIVKTTAAVPLSRCGTVVICDGAPRLCVCHIGLAGRRFGGQAVLVVVRPWIDLSATLVSAPYSVPSVLRSIRQQ